jgi:hypothetical protein
MGGLDNKLYIGGYMLDYAVAFTNFSGAYPNILAINATGPSTTDGTEFVANMINDSMWGVYQMILNHAGLSPNGVLESNTASQIKEALWKGFGAPPGVVTQWHLDDDPGVSGHRCLLLNGQGILRANYVDLDAAVYVGDANNATVAAGGGFYYRADDAAGTTPNIAGIYLILPETRGYVPRGLDLAATVDPGGASRFLGDIQADAGQKITGNFVSGLHAAIAAPVTASHAGVFSIGPANNVGYPSIAGSSNIADGVLFDSSGSTTPNAAKTDDVETRMTNFSTKFVIWY